VFLTLGGVFRMDQKYERAIEAIAARGARQRATAGYAVRGAGAEICTMGRRPDGFGFSPRLPLQQAGW
jgi:hypothetical protein